MAETSKKEKLQRYGAKSHDGGRPARLRLAAVGMEAEFNVYVDGHPARPEDVFGDPRAFLTGPSFHRIGTSYSLPTGGAVYFDTGVIEVATPVIEVERGCMARAGRSLWEGISHVRRALDVWERRTGRHVRLVGFSTHYNISFVPPDGDVPERTVERLALLLTYILPVPVMLLALNRRSSGVGVRPRGDRIEITADFTPSAALMIAAGTLCAGIARAVMRWPNYRLDRLDEHHIPVIEGFRPRKHTSRKGWLARKDGFPIDPFAVSPDHQVYTVHPEFFRGDEPHRLAMRDIASAIVSRFTPAIRSVSDAATLRLIQRVVRGAAPSMLDLHDRPSAYDDVGRLCLWDDLFPERILRRSRYERVLIRAIAGVPLRLGRRTYRPVGLRGWAEVVFRDENESLHSFPLDFLLDHLDTWERS
jgi:hypothetical protein